MTNSILTHQMIAREAADVFMEAAPFLKSINRGRESEFGSDVGGYKRGDTVSIKIPPTGTVYDGATFAGGGSAPAFSESSVSLQLSSQKHVPLTFTAKEKVLNITDFRERILKPQITTLASYVEADLIATATKLTPNLVGTPGSTPSTIKSFQQARQALQKNLCPSDPRTCLISSEANVELVDTSRGLFNPIKEVNNMFMTGAIGNALGADWYECVNLASITNGSKVASVTVSGGSQTGSSLLVGGVSNGDTFKKGSVFTIAGVHDVHPLTGNAYTTLRQFVITADTTASGSTVSLPIYPAITTAAPNQTVDASPANSAALTFVGSASTAYTQSLMYHRDAFTAAFAPLPILASCEGYTFSGNGFSIRVMTFGNGQSDTESTRVDVLYGLAAVRGIHACRITQ
ncbi:MAG TPA: P22 phage major capsid protein family protein [Terriglobales bacterium]|nr:P22 phage major capsid protein family protein [Terriglobales bacterium]